MRFFFPLLLILLSGILFFTIVDPLYSEVRDMRQNVAAYNVALDNSTELQKTRDQLVDVYKNIKQSDKNRLEHLLPNTVNNIRFILEIEQIANIHNMPIENIKFQGQSNDATKTAAGTIVSASDPSASKLYGVFPIEFTTTGSYTTFTAFLKDIEHNLRLVNVKSVSFSVPPPDTKAGTDPNNYTYSLKVETFWLK